MSLRKLLGKLLIFGVLQFGALTGAAMTQEDIEKLMNLMHRTKVVHVVKKDDS
ncbi:MAG TPA: hypothetical protein VF266_05015 [Thermoanaerobaculia bacterium]